MTKNRRRLCAEPLETRQLMASVSMPNVAIGPQQQLIAGLRIDDATDIRAAEVRIQYDPSTVRINQQSIRAGALWKDKAAVIAKVDESAGTITAFLFSSEPMQAATGDLLDIHFEPTRCAPQSQATSIDVKEVRLNEGQITLIDEPTRQPHRVDTASVNAPQPVLFGSDGQYRPQQLFHGPLRPEDVDAVMQTSQKPHAVPALSTQWMG